ncbi:MAG: ankyrin repeat domain-containing protein [Thermoguttaceae bacterium]|nr:ankyrin repeat domain-containing protein [Thermoguttaceae bacterium]
MNVKKFFALGLLFLLFCSTKSFGEENSSKEDVNKQLISAVQKGDEKAVEEFLKQGADPNTRIMRYMHETQYYSSNRPVLTEAASNGYKSIVNQLLSAGARIDEEYFYSHDTGGPWCDHTGMTALLQAVENRQWEVAELLVGKGADVNAVKRVRKFIMDYEKIDYYSILDLTRSHNAPESFYKLLEDKEAKSADDLNKK